MKKNNEIEVLASTFKAQPTTFWPIKYCIEWWWKIDRFWFAISETTKNKKISNWNLFQFIYFNLASDFLEFFFVLLSVILFLSRLWKNSFKAIRILRYISRLLIVSVLFPYLMLCVPSNYVNQWVGKVMVKKMCR